MLGPSPFLSRPCCLLLPFFSATSLSSKESLPPPGNKASLFIAGSWRGAKGGKSILGCITLHIFTSAELWEEARQL